MFENWGNTDISEIFFSPDNNMLTYKHMFLQFSTSQQSQHQLSRRKTCCVAWREEKLPKHKVEQLAPWSPLSYCTLQSENNMLLWRRTPQRPDGTRGLSLSVSSHLGIQTETVTKHRPGQMSPHSQMSPEDKQTQPPIRLLIVLPRAMRSK